MWQKRAACALGSTAECLRRKEAKDDKRTDGKRVSGRV
jgi:hypothetical protein